MEIFLALAEELHFGRTAERLHLSTARVSQTIMKLERRYGVRLFDRTSRRVELTAAGRQLYADLRLVARQWDTAENRVEAAGRALDGTLVVGFVGARAGRQMLRAADLMHGAHPECDVQVRESALGSAADELRSGTVDLLTAMLPARDPGLAQSPVLFAERRGLAVPADHPYAGRASVTSAEAVSTVLLHPAMGPLDDWDDRLLSEASEHGPGFATIEEMLTLIGAGLGSYPGPEGASRYYQRPDVGFLPISDAPPYRWGLVWRVAATNARIRTFVETCTTMAGPLT
jgi:DNA-binding transcriptional LysR family regulator